MNTFDNGKVPKDLRDLFDDFKLEIFEDFNCHRLAKIVSFDKTTQTAVVQPVGKKQIPDGRALSYPQLQDVLVYFAQGGGAFLEFPITKGDLCVVLFNDSDLDVYWSSQNDALPNTYRMHSLSDGIAIVGLNTKISPLPLEQNGVKLNGGVHKVDVKNTAQSMAARIGALFDLFTTANFTTYGSPSNQAMSPTTQAAFAAEKALWLQLWGHD